MPIILLGIEGGHSHEAFGSLTMNIWTRLAISVALLGLFCIVCSEMIERDGFYDSNRQRIAAAMSAVGTVLFLVGRVVNRKRALRLAAERKACPAPDEEDSEDA